jgi:dUTP pyrophosphatase
MANMLPVDVIITDGRLGEIFPLPDEKDFGNAGMDLRVMSLDGDNNNTWELLPNETKVFNSGLRIHIKDENVFLAIYPRSGLGCKGLIIANTVGVIDSNYTGEIKISLYNRSKEKMILKAGDRVVQGVLQPILHPVFKIVTEFSSETTRGNNSFGSSGIE